MIMLTRSSDKIFNPILYRQQYYVAVIVFPSLDLKHVSLIFFLWQQKKQVQQKQCTANVFPWQMVTEKQFQLSQFLCRSNYTGCFTKGYRKLNHYKTCIYKNIPMKHSQNVHHINKFLSTEFFNRTAYI